MRQQTRNNTEKCSKFCHFACVLLFKKNLPMKKKKKSMWWLDEAHRGQIFVHVMLMSRQTGKLMSHRCTKRSRHLTWMLQQWRMQHKQLYNSHVTAHCSVLLVLLKFRISIQKAFIITLKIKCLYQIRKYSDIPAVI